MSYYKKSEEILRVKLSEVPITEEVKQAVLSVLESGWFTLGERLREFEKNFAAFIGTKHAVGVSSGTAAIHAVLLALGVKQGDEVLVPSHTAFPTVEPIIMCGATPVFVDIDPSTFTMDPSDAKKKITSKTRVLIPVHLYGHPCKLDEFSELCSSKGIALVEDSCQAHGAMFKGRRTGSFGIAGCFSFYPSKNLTVAGEGGMITTDDSKLDERLRMLRHHGMSNRYTHELVGHNFRLSEIHAAIGNCLLQHLPKFNKLRVSWANMYRELLGNLPLQLPSEASWAHHVWHLYVIRSRKRDALMNHLKQKGIASEVHYRIPCHLQPALSWMPRVRLQATEEAVKEILSLPMHPLLDEGQVNYVADSIRDFCRNEV